MLEIKDPLFQKEKFDIKNKPRNKRCPLFTTLLICLTTTFCFYSIAKFPLSETEYFQTIVELISTAKFEDLCRHPTIDFFDPEIMTFYKNLTKPICIVENGNLTFLKNGVLINTSPGTFDCWGRCHTFRNPKKTWSGKWIHTNQTYQFTCDIIEARCSPKEMNISASNYYYFHTQIVEIPNEKREKPKVTPKGKQFDVYFFVVDSQAYSQMYRNLNQTNRFLLEDLEGIPFPYVNRIGGTSRPNGFAWLFGKMTEPVDRSIYNLSSLYPEPQWKASCNRKLDNESIITGEFRDYGYMTAHVADWWRTIDYTCKGADRKFTHHSYTPYALAYESDKKIHEYMTNKQCLQRHEHAIQYFDQFVNSYEGLPKMAFMWLTWVGHNSEAGSSDADLHFYPFFKKNKKIFENSFVFFAGDHGMRFTDAVKTKIGMYDVNNPMLMITVPRELRKETRILEILRENSGELQTHYDTRATLLDILRYQPSANFNNHSLLTIPGELGHSQLREQPKPRTCRTLPIPPEFCICEQPINIDVLATNPNRTKTIGIQTIYKINERLKTNETASKCRTWTFQNTIKLVQTSEIPYLHFKGSFSGTNSRKSLVAEFYVTLGGKEDAKLEILSLDRVDHYGDSGNCVSKEFQPICDCQR